MKTRKEYPQHAGARLRRPIHSLKNLPEITKELASLGIQKWCSTENPHFDCTGRERIGRGRVAHTSELEYVKHKLILQRAAMILHHNYHELRVKDIALLIGYNESYFRKILMWKLPKNIRF